MQIKVGNYLLFLNEYSKYVFFDKKKRIYSFVCLSINQLINKTTSVLILPLSFSLSNHVIIVMVSPKFLKN
jgi:hypothetical protein